MTTLTDISAQDVDLRIPVMSDTVLEVRSGKMKPMDGLKILSGIDKDILHGPAPVTKMGILGDEHDPTFHGGVDKAIHAYCSVHYDSWKQDFPTASSRFRPGAFGENLVFARFNERNVHIGDVYSVGPASGSSDGLLLQVSLPRQPCFKLNHRFGLQNFAPNTWKTSRTGWYYRVLRPGHIQAGDEVRLVERHHPDWPLERVQEYLHRRPWDDVARVAELAAIDDFGDECKNQLRSRLAKMEKMAKKKAAAENDEAGQREEWSTYSVVEKRTETPRITAFVLERNKEGQPDQPEEDEDPPPGCHVKLRLPNGLVRVYSVVCGNRHRFEIAVALVDANVSRGGSRFLHTSVDVGSSLDLHRPSSFAQSVPMASAASHHIFVAGGVGITAFLAVMQTMKAWAYGLELHYAVRSAAADVPYRAQLDALVREAPPDTIRVHIYAADRGERLQVGHLVRSLPWNGHINFCGPPGLMQEALRETTAAGLVIGESAHFEAFSADTTGDPFEVEVLQHPKAGSANHVTPPGAELPASQIFQVDADSTLLEVLQKHLGTDVVASSCEVGNCGTCKISVRKGHVDHRGTALGESEKHNSMLACVSRGIGRLVVEL